MARQGNLDGTPGHLWLLSSSRIFSGSTQIYLRMGSPGACEILDQPGDHWSQSHLVSHGPIFGFFWDQRFSKDYLSREELLLAQVAWASTPFWGHHKTLLGLLATATWITPVCQAPLDPLSHKAPVAGVLELLLGAARDPVLSVDPTLRTVPLPLRYQVQPWPHWQLWSLELLWLGAIPTLACPSPGKAHCPLSLCLCVRVLHAHLAMQASHLLAPSCKGTWRSEYLASLVPIVVGGLCPPTNIKRAVCASQAQQ